MKTRIDISFSLFSDKTLEEGIYWYNRAYKDKGYILDGEIVYKDVDKEIHLKEGDRIWLEEIGFMIVKWKCHYIIEDYIEYSVEDE